MSSRFSTSRVASAALAMGIVLAMAANARADAPSYGVRSTTVSVSTTQAGAHPDLTASVELETDPSTGSAPAGTRDVVVDLPPGLVATAAKFPTCPIDDFLNSPIIPEAPPCPVDSQIGVINLGLNNNGENGVLPEPLYHLPGGGLPVRLGFFSLVMPQVLGFKARPEDEYGLRAEIMNASDLFVMNSAEVVIWGVPSDSSHDPLRLTPYEALNCGYACEAPRGARPSDLPPLPLTVNPTRCGPAIAHFALTSYALPGEVFESSADVPPISGCEAVPFAPTADLAATTQATDAAGGLSVEVGLPPASFESADGIASSAVRRMVVSLPPGYSLNAAAAAGLLGCGARQVGLVADHPLRFDNSRPACPEASKLGSAEIESPLLDKTLHGDIYLATPEDNPFRSLVALYVVAEGEGVNLKLAGRLVLDPSSGQVKASFDEMPPLPISDISLDLEGGDNGLVASPLACGRPQGEVDLYSWSGREATRTITVPTGQGPAGGTCAEPAFAPRLTAGTTRAVAGAASPLVVRIARSPGEQHLERFRLRLPKGLLPDLAKVAVCDAADASSGTCSPSSQVGTASVLSGAGPTPLRFPEPGSPAAPVYLAGPADGAPFSLVTAMAARAGPFDLGRVVLRALLDVNPRTAQVTVRSRLLPQVLDGIPVAYRQLRFDFDRAGFIRNPTNCGRSRIGATLTAAEGAIAGTSVPFAVNGCRQLRFQPRVALSMTGSTAKGGHPALTAHLATVGGENVSRIAILLPASELLDTRHISGVCARAALNRNRCGKGTVYGRARAISPLLSRPLRGLVHLSAGHSRLPNLVASMKGQVALELVGRIDSARGRLRATFSELPDAPLRELDLMLAGGRRGLLVNGEGLCRAAPRARVVVWGQDGSRRVLKARVIAGVCS